MLGPFDVSLVLLGRGAGVVAFRSGHRREEFTRIRHGSVPDGSPHTAPPPAPRVGCAEDDIVESRGRDHRVQIVGEPSNVGNSANDTGSDSPVPRGS